MEGSQDNRQQRATPFIDAKAESNTEESVYLHEKNSVTFWSHSIDTYKICHCDESSELRVVNFGFCNDGRFQSTG